MEESLEVVVLVEVMAKVGRIGGKRYLKINRIY